MIEKIEKKSSHLFSWSSNNVKGGSFTKRENNESNENFFEENF